VKVEVRSVKLKPREVIVYSKAIKERQNGTEKCTKRHYVTRSGK